MSSSYQHYDVIVIGGGHAGCEAALAAGRMGARVLFITMNVDHVAQMSCNPSIGGIAKGQVVREIDALGGEMARNTDATAIQFRMLNQSKGPAVWSPRAQCDKLLYQRRMKHVVESEKQIFLHQAEVVSVLREGDRIAGVVTHFDERFYAKAVVICTGTFLRGLLHYGMKQVPGGRAGDAPANELSVSLLEDLDLTIGRLKTGTPPRVMAKSLDFAEMEEQPSDPNGRFCHWPEAVKGFTSLAPDPMPQRSCYMVRSTLATRDLVRENIHQAPMYNGQINAIGTRYCPSFEDKVMRFPHHETHQIFLEPEGAFTEEYYINGISTSLPTGVQWLMIRSLPGMARAELSRYAYAVEYDFVLPHQLRSSLALERWPNLFLAGQINGTTGYEEAGGQGLIAGINAARLAAGDLSPLVLGRDQAYIGVMVDDLVTKDVHEPYRLFTSRAEYRLLLRQDNACRRLSQVGYDLGLLSGKYYAQVQAEERQIADGHAFLKGTRQGDGTLWDNLRRQKLDLTTLSELKHCSASVFRQLEVEAFYEGYLQKEVAQAAQLRKLEAWRIPADFSYEMQGLRHEARTKLNRLKPETLAQAARLDGVTPAEIGLLQVHLKRHAAAKRSAATTPES
jgi:tRNA uridine 5-carboxymethylaminomethyl modification enzyme